MENTTATDLFHQSFVLQEADGTQYTVTMDDLNAFTLYGRQICIILGTQIGACITLLVVLTLLIKPEKRGSPIFVVNSLALIFDIIRSVLTCMYFTGPFEEVYAHYTQDYTFVRTRDYAESITVTVFNLLLLICVEISLCLQTQVVCVTLRQTYRHAILATSILITLLAISFRFAYMVENCILIIQAEAESSIEWLGSATNITTTLSIFWFCSVFVTKLGVSLYQRKKLGMGQSGPMEIIFIMGCQTLIIPAIFSVLQYYVLTAMSSFTLTSTALFLPLSSLWASASLNGRFRHSKNQMLGLHLFGDHGSRSTTPMVESHNLKSPLSTSNASISAFTNGLPDPHDNSQHQAAHDLEAQGLGGIGGFARRELE